MAKLIDTHFHLDKYRNHKEIFEYLNRKKIYTLCMTDSPGVYVTCKRLYSHGKYVRHALGFHPLNIGLTDKDFSEFLRLLPRADYVGEVGLDFSNKKGLPQNRQVDYFEIIVRQCARLNKLMSIHSNGAVDEIIRILSTFKPKRCIIHWFTGTEQQLKKLVEVGCYFSINTNMAMSNPDLIRLIPLDRVLIESDGPYTRVNGQRYNPRLLPLEYNTIAGVLANTKLNQTVYNNFGHILDLRSSQVY